MSDTPGVVHDPANPWTWEAVDYQDSLIRITVPWTAGTRALQDGTVYRDPACVYVKIYMGVGLDGTVNTTPAVFAVPAGTTALTAVDLSGKTLNKIDDITALQITAGP